MDVRGRPHGRMHWTSHSSPFIQAWGRRNSVHEANVRKPNARIKWSAKIAITFDRQGMIEWELHWICVSMRKIYITCRKTERQHHETNAICSIVCNFCELLVVEWRICSHGWWYSKRYKITMKEWTVWKRFSLIDFDWIWFSCSVNALTGSSGCRRIRICLEASILSWIGGGGCGSNCILLWCMD